MPLSTPSPSLLARSLTLVALLAPGATAQFHVGPEELVEAGGTELVVNGYSVPSWADWNGDGLMDLVVGEGSGTDRARVRYYLNAGAPGAPAFGGYGLAMSQGAVLTLPGGG